MPPVVEIPLRGRDGSVRAVAIVDEADAHLAQHRWCLSTKGYVTRLVGGRTNRIGLALHREVLGLQPGDGLLADHINGDPLDNRRENLRAVNHSGNAQNLHRVRAASGVRGVHWHEEGRKWAARAKLNGRQYHLGLFSEIDAAAAAVAAFRAERMPFSPEARAATN